MNTTPGFDRHRAGVLLHPTSLPEGTLGNGAFRFVEFMQSAGFSVWQVLPVGLSATQGSPYSPLSVFAGNPELIDRAGAKSTMVLCEKFFRTTGENQDRFHAFCERERDWLDDFALFLALKSHSRNQPWWQWPHDIRVRQPSALHRLRVRYRSDIELFQFEQFLFARQWQALRTFARGHGVLLCGDLPMFVVLDSVEVWVHRTLFRLDADDRPAAVAGVPPDAFATEGQRWGNPLYDWNAMQEDNFAWWCCRIAHELRRFDLLRLDHFRGLAACWEISTDAESAAEGRWGEVPGGALLQTLLERLGSLPLIAENLGTITEDVENLRRQFDLPGMHVLQFAFDGSSDNSHLPENHTQNAVVYTGTHDNDTTKAWYCNLEPAIRDEVDRKFESQASDMPDALIRAALQSRASLAIIPMQDLLGLGAGHRMNVPGTEQGNWRWRFSWDQVSGALEKKYRQMISDSGRLPGAQSR